jgi:hypothetical protein|mmetsp:Transcript_50621/g.84651  ORF Transcript_50621/g.84651 Transcript_50621/m.84651 type:complete len:94 (-) Transcript_50621:658-939(-)
MVFLYFLLQNTAIGLLGTAVVGSVEVSDQNFSTGSGIGCTMQQQERVLIAPLVFFCLRTMSLIVQSNQSNNNQVNIGMRIDVVSRMCCILKFC